MGFLSGLFGGGSKNNPANAAMPYLNKIPGVAQENLGPWANQGQTAQTTNAGIYNNLATNPMAEYEKIHAGYKPSAGYQFKSDQYKKAIEGAAAAGGNRGSLGDMAAQTQLQQSLMAEDENNYYDKIYNLMGLGLQGNENVANRGFAGASDLTNILGSNLGAQAELAYKGKENENANNDAVKKMIFQLIGAGLGSFGGPTGAAVGSNIGGALAGGGSSSGSKPSNSQIFGDYLFKMGQ